MMLEMKLFKEYRAKHPQNSISTLRPDKNNPYVFYVYFFGKNNTIHHNARYKLQINLGKDFPQNRPCVQFLDPVPFHCNINCDGRICSDMLSFWDGKNYYIRDILDTLNFFLYNPDNSNPYNNYGLEGSEMRKEYERRSKE